MLSTVHHRGERCSPVLPLWLPVLCDGGDMMEAHSSNLEKFLELTIYWNKLYQKCYCSFTWICKRHRKYLKLNNNTSIDVKIFKKIIICDYVNKNTKCQGNIELTSVALLITMEIYNIIDDFLCLFLLVSLYQLKFYCYFCHSLHCSRNTHFWVCDLNTNACFFQILWIFSSCFVIGSQLCTIYHTGEAITFIFLGTEKFDKVDTWHIELW